MDYNKLLKKFDTYYGYILNNNSKKFTKVVSGNNKKEIFNFLKKYTNKKFNDTKIELYNVVLIKIKKVEYNPNQPIKMVFGPIKLEIDFFEITKRFAIKTNNFENRNNHLFYTIKFLENNKISKKHFKKMIQLAINNKLEKRLLAPKTIDQLI